MQFIHLKTAGILIFLILVSLSGFAQTDSSFFQRTTNSLENYSAAVPIEKVYLHLDKYGYLPGDTIWFKAYTVAGESHKLSAISNVLHVELLTESDSVCTRIFLPMESGLSLGNIALPLLIEHGTYHIRAYTNWMRNFEPDYFFDQPVFVKEIQTQKLPQKQKKSTSPDVQFFPESGSLINGLRSKLAVKATDAKGMGEDVIGSIVDNDGKEVTVFSTQHLGLGALAFTPQHGKNYKARITSKNGSQFSVNLPKAQENGFVLTVNNNDADSLLVKVAASNQLFESKRNIKYYLFGQSGGKVYYTAHFALSAATFTLQIDKKLFPTGILQLTLFAADAEPLNERLVFIQHQDQLKLNVSSAKIVYAPRQQVNLSLKASDKENKAVIGSFSASVINEDFAGEQAPASTILTNFLLTSEIKGYIEQPDYYFSKADIKTTSDLDLLMLTQGYHRFEWKKILNGNPGLVYEPENALELSGYIKTFGGKPLAKSKVSLFTTQAGGQWLDTVTDAKGRFTFKGLIPDTTVKYSVQGRTVKDKKNLEISLDTIASFTSKKSHINLNQPVETAQTSYQKQIIQQLQTGLSGRIIPLKEVTIKAKKEPLSGTWHPDQVLRDFPEDVSGQTLSQYLIPRVNGTIFLNGLPYNTRFPKTPMNIILNGFKIENEMFMMLNVGDIEGVEILRTTGNRDIITGLGNVLILTSKKHTGTNKGFLPDVITYKSNGFYKAKEFYSPVYKVTNLAINKPDLRTTIYWNPNIITDKDGNASLSFFNADTKGTYRLTVEGIDGEGNLGHQVYTYKVE